MQRLDDKIRRRYNDIVEVNNYFESTGVPQSKSRMRAVAITDIAISKVSVVKFRGFTEQENNLIREYHKLLLLLPSL